MMIFFIRKTFDRFSQRRRGVLKEVFFSCNSFFAVKKSIVNPDNGYVVDLNINNLT